MPARRAATQELVKLAPSHHFDSLELQRPARPARRGPRGPPRGAPAASSPRQRPAGAPALAALAAPRGAALGRGPRGPSPGPAPRRGRPAPRPRAGRAAERARAQPARRSASRHLLQQQRGCAKGTPCRLPPRSIDGRQTEGEG